MTAQYTAADWYALPAYYDIVFDADTRQEGAFLEAVRARFGRTRGRRVLEPACGSGRLVAEMARRGYRVHGFDLEPAMLDYARRRLERRGLRATLRQARMEDFQSGPRFDLAHCLISTFKYLLDERAARNHLRCVARSVKPGGVYVLGFHLTEYGSDRFTRERWVGRRGRTEVTCNTQFWPPDRRRRLERVRARLTVRRPSGVQRFETNWMFRTYDAPQVQRLLQSVPALRHVATFDFTYDIERPLPFDGERLDVVLVFVKE